MYVLMTLLKELIFIMAGRWEAVTKRRSAPARRTGG
jgi:hypothetical protein